MLEIKIIYKKSKYFKYKIYFYDKIDYKICGEYMEHPLIIFISAVGVALFINLILKRFALPTILGYIFSGVIINYAFMIQSNTKISLEHVAEFGIVFLMFTIGLEFSIRHLKSMKKEVFLYGFLQVFLTGIIFATILNQLLSFEIKSAIVVGFALSLSSTAIVLKILNERGEMHSGYGRISVGILIFQDLAVIPILLMISIFVNKDQSISELLVYTMISAVIVFFIIFVAGRFFIDKFLDFVISSNSEEIFLITILFLVISSSMIAHSFGFSYSLGAFLAGMTIAETKFRYRVEADLTPFRDILLGVFFVSIGLQIDLVVGYENILEIIMWVIAVMGLKFLILFIILSLFNQKRTALKSSLALFEIGEFSLAIFALARNSNLIDNRLEQILILSVVISMIISPFVLKNIKNIADKFFSEPEFNITNIDNSGYKDHIIICGYGDLGKSLANKFKQFSLLYIIVEHDSALVEEAKKDNHPVILANAAQKEVLQSLNIEDSLAVMVAISNAKKLRLICENISSFDSNINSIVKVNNDSHESIIKDLKINHIVNQSKEMTKLLMEEAVKCKIG